MANLFNKIKDCIDRDDIECLKRYVKTKKDADIAQDTNYGPVSALRYAVEKGSKESAKLLIDKGANVNNPTKDFRSILAHLVHWDWIDLAQKVVDNKSPVAKHVFVETLTAILTQSGSSNYTSSQLAHFIDSLVKHVMGSDGILTRYLSRNDITSILVHSLQDVRLDLLRHFVNTYNLDVKNYTDERGNSLLHLAARAGSLDKVRFLVEEKGILPSVVNKKLRTPLHRVASAWGLNSIARYIDIVKYLIDKGADIRVQDKSKQTPIELLMEGIKDIPKQIIDKGPNHIPAGLGALSDLLNHLIRQGKLSKEELDKYTPSVYRILTSKEVRGVKQVQYALLSLPIKGLLLQFLEKQLSKLCEEKR